VREVTIKRTELLKRVQDNRIKHIAEYQAAVAGYKTAAIDAINKATQRLQRQVEELEEGETIHIGSIAFNLAVPQDHQKDYDQAIAMLEMSVDDEITIRGDDFAHYAMDDWAWKTEFLNVSNHYKNLK
jgi:hypothetical protein